MTAEKEPMYTAPDLVWGVFQITATGQHLLNNTVYHSMPAAERVRDDHRKNTRYSGTRYEVLTLRIR